MNFWITACIFLATCPTFWNVWPNKAAAIDINGPFFQSRIKHGVSLKASVAIKLYSSYCSSVFIFNTSVSPSTTPLPSSQANRMIFHSLLEAVTFVKYFLLVNMLGLSAILSHSHLSYSSMTVDLHQLTTLSNALIS